MDGGATHTSGETVESEEDEPIVGYVESEDSGSAGEEQF